MNLDDIIRSCAATFEKQIHKRLMQVLRQVAGKSTAQAPQFFSNSATDPTQNSVLSMTTWPLLKLKFTDLFFHFAPCATPKRVTSLRSHFRVIAHGQHSCFRRNVAAVASRWQLYFRFDRSEI